MALVSVVIGAVGQFLLKLAARSLGSLALFGPDPLSTAVRLITNPYLLLGLVCFGSSMLLWVKVLTTAQLSTAYPLVSFGYVIVAALSWWALGEHLSLRQLLALALIIVGVALLGMG